MGHEHDNNTQISYDEQYSSDEQSQDEPILNDVPLDEIGDPYYYNQRGNRRYYRHVDVYKSIPSNSNYDVTNVATGEITSYSMEKIKFMTIPVVRSILTNAYETAQRQATKIHAELNEDMTYPLDVGNWCAVYRIDYCNMTPDELLWVTEQNITPNAFDNNHSVLLVKLSRCIHQLASLKMVLHPINFGRKSTTGKYTYIEDEEEDEPSAKRQMIYKMVCTVASHLRIEMLNDQLHKLKL
jgi:hypothetical protein